MATSPPITTLKIEDFAKFADAIGSDEADRLFRALNTALSTTAGQSSSALVMNGQAWQVKDLKVMPKDDWSTVALSNGWTNFVAGEPAQSLKMDSGLVYTRGRLVPGANGAVAYTLPAQSAPSRTRYLDVTAAGAANGTSIVSTTGTVTLSFNGAPAWVAIDTSWVALDRHPEPNSIFPMRVRLELGGRKVQGVWAIQAHDLDGLAEQHIGNSVWIDGRQDGEQFIIDSISGLGPGRTYHVRILFLGA